MANATEKAFELNAEERKNIGIALELYVKSIARAMKAQRDLGRQAIAEALQQDLKTVQALQARF